MGPSCWVRLKFAAMNLKTLARWKSRFPAVPVPALFSRLFPYYVQRPAWKLSRQAVFRQAEGQQQSLLSLSPLSDQNQNCSL